MTKKNNKKVEKQEERNTTLLVVLVAVFVVVLGVFALKAKKFDFFGKSPRQIMDGIVTKQETDFVKKFFTDNKKELFGDKVNLDVKSVMEEDGLVVVRVTINGQEKFLYLTEDYRLAWDVLSVEAVTKGKDKVLPGVDKKGDVAVNNEKLKNAIKKFLADFKVFGPGVTVEVKNITEDAGLYKISASVNKKDRDFYLTKMATKFIFQVMTLDKYKEMMNKTSKNAKKKIPPKRTVSKEKKSDKPKVDIFVMSYCPYGTQFEKGALPALRTLGDKVEARIKFVNYAMHGKKEIDENLLQYCIEEKYPNKFYDYLECFLQAGKSEECLKSQNINKTVLDGCIKETDEKFSITKNFEDRSTWSGSYPSFVIDDVDNKKFGITSSPTMVVNGEVIAPEGRDPQSILKAICSGFKTEPEECKKTLSSVPPKSGFGSGGGGSDGGGCGQ